MPTATDAPRILAAHRFTLPVTSEANLAVFVKLAFGVTVPNTQVCPNHTTPWRAFCDAFFARSSVAVWHAARGFGGKSHLLALLAAVESVLLKAGVSVLGGSGEQSARVLDHMRDLWGYRNAPRHHLLGDPAREMRMAGGNVVRALMASSASVRGPHPQRLRLDEVDEMDLEIFDAAMGQPMSKPGVPTQVVASSTHHYADGTMTEVLRRAADKGWPVHRWCWRETSNPVDGWLSADEIERKRRDITEAMWSAEYDLQEPSPESRAIQPGAVARMFRRDLGQHRGAVGEYVEAEAPQPGATYSTGADWARKQDYTEIVTWRTDCRPVRLVAYERMRRADWPVMVSRFEQRIKRFPGASAHDATGLGDVIDGFLTVKSQGVILAGRERSDILSAYIAAIEHGEAESPMIDALESQHRMASYDDVFGSSQSGHLPDGICAGALAWHAWSNRPKPWSQGAW
jgi:hypothetical protein